MANPDLDHPFTAVVLAGDRELADPLAQKAGVSCKAMIKIDGTPMVLRVLDALESSGHIDGRILSGPRLDHLRSEASVNRLVELLGAERSVHIPKRPGEPDCTLADVSKIRQRIGWNARVPIEDGVRIMLDNVDYWRDAPVWTADKIADATSDWFRYLSHA